MLRSKGRATPIILEVNVSNYAGRGPLQPPLLQQELHSRLTDTPRCRETSAIPVSTTPAFVRMAMVSIPSVDASRPRGVHLHPPRTPP